MADTYYAYSRFNTKVNEWGTVEESVMPGEEVTQEQLGVDDETWAMYLEQGIVSSVPHPETQPGESPNEAFAREDAALAAGELDEEVAAKVKERQEAQAKAASGVMEEATALAAADKGEEAAALIEESLGDDEGESEGESANPNVPADASDAEKPVVESSVSRDYENMTQPQLRTLAAKRDIPDRNSMDKAALINALREQDQSS